MTIHKNKKTLVLLIAVSMLLSGCVSWTDPAVLHDRQTSDLCQAYDVFSGRVVIGVLPTSSYPERLDAIKKELDRRDAVKPHDWQYIDKSTIKIGMSECALLAAWGQPQTINHTVTAANDAAQYVYSLSRYAYMTNGRVTAIQY